jgi:hypothetical protein
MLNLPKEDLALLMQYVELGNTKGPDSSEAQAFRAAHASNQALTQRFLKTDAVRKQLASGELVCDDQGNVIP